MFFLGLVELFGVIKEVDLGANIQVVIFTFFIGWSTAEY